MYVNELKIVKYFNEQSLSINVDWIKSGINHFLRFAQKRHLNRSLNNCLCYDIGFVHALSEADDGTLFPPKKYLGQLCSNILYFCETVSQNVSSSRNRAGITIRNFTTVEMCCKLFCFGPFFCQMLSYIVLFPLNLLSVFLRRILMLN